MRVVLVAHDFPRWPGDVPGSFLGPVASALVARGHTVCVVAPADRGRADGWSIGGAEVVQVRYAAARRETLAYSGTMLRAVRTPIGAWTFWRLVRALRAGARAAARRIHADVIHAFWWVPGGWAAVGSDVPAVVTLMGTDIALLRYWPVRLLARSVLTRAARVTAISHFLANRARARLELPTLPIDCVPVPVATERFTRPSRGGGGITYLGRLTEQKRVHLLLDAVHAAGIRRPVTIVGDGPARADLESRARTLGLDNVRFVGSLDDAEVLQAIGDADVAAFPSHEEGLGLAAAEATMLGIPVVATSDGGGVLDLLKDGAGASIVRPDAAEFGAALARFLGDPSAREAAAIAGAALRERLSAAAIAAAYERVYGSTLG